MSGQCSLCSDFSGLECSGGENCFFFKYRLREKMMEDNEYFVSFKNLIDNVYHRSMDQFLSQIQLTCHINNHIMGAEVAAKIAEAQFSAAQAAEAAAQAEASVVKAATAHAATSAQAAEASAAQAAASVVQAAVSVAQAAASVAQAAAHVAASVAQASATVADQDAATVGTDEVVNESGGIRFWNKTKACLGHAIHLLAICSVAAGACA